jgi:hypothetical protein
MRRKRQAAILAAVIALFGGILAAGSLSSCRKGPSSLKGAVLERNSDPRKESPIADVEVSASIGSVSSVTKTGSSGEFSINLRRWIRRGQPMMLKFRRPGYEPLELHEVVSDKIYVVHMAPVPARAEPEPNRPEVSIANVKIRYSMKTTAAVSVGSAVKTFEVANSGNIPCNGRPPCSPDGKWKASVASTALDAGEGNEFRNVRLSCIAGPCPFTKVESDGVSEGGSKIQASVLNWSDTTTFLLEAEVYHPMESEIIRESHPAIFGRTLNFSVPGSAEGQSIEADVNGETIIFPLGPSLCLSWADCSVATDRSQNKTYRCELKNGYQFR